ncbi:MAG: NB-ARC domain-containing protein [Pleurocapsa sp. MO_226.B13]|nr:NB-ARC domain-containing protein [Pleurocapsa sp. MO_226.B13]
MTEKKSQRTRGFILTSTGLSKLQERIRQLETRNKRRYTPQLISQQIGLIDTVGLHSKTIRKVLQAQKAVDPRTLRLVFKVLDLNLTEDDYASADLRSPPSEDKITQTISLKKRFNWIEAMEFDSFYGRSAELTQLERWILEERCRVVAILGMGGMGKTTLSQKIAQQIQGEFEYIFWQSLRNAPPLSQVLVRLIRFLSDEKLELVEFQQQTEEHNTALVLEYLCSSRCLIVLDNVETILSSGDRTGSYRPGYENYGEFLTLVAQTQHQSCVLLTARERPKEIGILAGTYVRSLLLKGLSAAESQKIFSQKNCFYTDEAELKGLIEYYRGNPLGLKIIAATIAELLDGNVSEGLNYLNQGSFLFDDIRDLLTQQFKRLSELEREVMYWLAINREQVSLNQLQDDIISPVARQKLLSTLNSLQRRSLIEKISLTINQNTTFTLQPVVMEYIIEQLIEKAVGEISDREINLWRSHSLIKARSLNYVRDTQIRLILNPIIERLQTIFPNQKSLEDRLLQILVRLQLKFPLQPGYTAGNILNLLVQIGTNLRGYDFSNLTLWQAYLRNANLSEVNFSGADLSKSMFAQSFSGILSVAFSPDGKFLAAGDTNGIVHLWQMSNAQKLLTCKAHRSWVTSFAYSPDGKILASSSSTDYTIKLWDISTGCHLNTLRGHNHGIWAVAFSPNGNTLASGSEDCSVKFWDIYTGECLQTFVEQQDEVWSVAFSPDGNILANVGDDFTIELWDIPSHKCLQTFSGHSDWILSLGFSPDGKILASGSGDRTIKLWDVNSGHCLQTLLGHSNQIRSLVFSPDGKTLVSSSDDRTVKIWEIDRSRCLRTLLGHSNNVRSVTITAPRNCNNTKLDYILASGSEDFALKVWNTRTGECLSTLRGYHNGVWSVAFDNSSNNLLASGHDDSRIRIWNLDTASTLRILQGHSNRVLSVIFSYDNQILASGSEDCSTILWDVNTGRCLQKLQGHQSGVRSLAFTRDNRILASGSDDRTIKLWDVSTGQCLKTLRGHTNRIRSIAIQKTANGLEVLASGSDDETIELWNISTGKSIQTLKDHTSWVRSVAFSYDGCLLASGSDDGSVKIWDTATGECIQTLEEHNSWVWSVAFAPVALSGNYTVASSSEDRTVKIYRTQNNQTLSGHSSLVCCVTFSGDGKILASGSQDETIKLWNVETGECINTLRTERPYEGMNLTATKGLTKAQIENLKALGAIQL